MLVGVALAVPAPEADSKADPQLIYTGYAYAGVFGYPNGYRLIGRRSAGAESESDAKADPQFFIKDGAPNHIQEDVEPKQEGTSPIQ